VRFESRGDVSGDWDADRLAQAVSNLIGNRTTRRRILARRSQRTRTRPARWVGAPEETIARVVSLLCWCCGRPA
jgi:hypothetical protein